MKKKYLIGTLAILVIVSAIYIKKKSSQIDHKQWIQKIRDENQPLMDSIQQVHYLDNILREKIRKSIDVEDFQTAYALIDSIKGYDREYTILFYEGMILEKQRKYDEAIEKYSIILKDRVLPGTLAQRAAIYTKQNKLDLSLQDYMEAYKKNFDFSLDVAATFERMNLKDSALRYYKIYLNHYPQDTLIQNRLHHIQ